MKVSIITTTYNSERTIKFTLESVLKQKYIDYEHIIIDGMSKDRTIQIVKEYEEKYSGKLKYISEEDLGIYDAMNKGIKMATGDIIGILNSDDIYAHEKVLEEIVNTIKEHDCDGIYGNLIFMDKETMTKPQRIWNSPKGKLENGWHPAHPTLYLKKEVYNKIGIFNLKYKIASDYDFMLRLLLNKEIKLEYINDYIIYMRAGGTSTEGIKGYLNNLKEANIVLKDNNIKHPYIVNIKRIIKTINQMMVSKYKKIK